MLREHVVQAMADAILAADGRPLHQAYEAQPGVFYLRGVVANADGAQERTRGITVIVNRNWYHDIAAAEATEQGQLLSAFEDHVRVGLAGYTPQHGPPLFEVRV